MQDLVVNPATVAVAALLAAWAVWAVRRMTTRGLCDCGAGKTASRDSGTCSACAAAGGCGACAGSCPAAELMLEGAARASRG